MTASSQAGVMRRDAFKLARLPAGAKADALAQGSAELYARRQNLAGKLSKVLAPGLPVSDEASQILSLVERNQVVIVAAKPVLVKPLSCLKFVCKRDWAHRVS